MVATGKPCERTCGEASASSRGRDHLEIVLFSAKESVKLVF